MLLIDGDILVYRCGFAAEEDTEANACLTMDSQIKFIKERCNWFDYRVFLSGTGNFREQIAVTKPYKGNRKDARKPKHYERLRKHLREWHGAEVVDGIEADDAIGIAASTSKNERIVVSIDKDLLQIPGRHYNWVRDEHRNVSRKEGTIRLYSQILTGDPTDNVPGIRGIGPKTAQRVLAGSGDLREVFDRTWSVYKDNGKPFSYFLEQANLIYIHRKPNDRYEPPYIPDPEERHGGLDRNSDGAILHQ